MGTRTGRGFCEKAEAVSRLGTRAAVAVAVVLLVVLVVMLGPGGSR